VDEEQRFTCLNDSAAELFGKESCELIGSHCYECVCGVDQNGGSICGPSCARLAEVRGGGELEPFLLRRPPAAVDRAYIVTILPLEEAPGGPLQLVHLAHDVSRLLRMEHYFRSAVPEAAEAPAPHEVLSPREREILELLSQSHESKRIARELSISYSTVRNHIQRILSKLRVHSVQEAIARHLIQDPLGSESREAE
jgi:DNA-binding CsgD family transcriptional regulator